MKKIIIHSGFHPEQKREYNGEHIYTVTAVRNGLEGKDYHTGAILSSRDLGFMILRVDRSRGLL